MGATHFELEHHIESNIVFNLGCVLDETLFTFLLLQVYISLRQKFLAQAFSLN